MTTLEQVVDEATIEIAPHGDPTSIEWRNHRVDSSQVGRFLGIYLTNHPGNATLWSPAPYEDGPNAGRWYSENLNGLQMTQDANLIYTDIKIPLNLPNGQPAEGQEYWIRYKMDEGGNKHTIAVVRDEIDRYWIALNIDYMDNGQQETKTINVPGSVFKYLWQLPMNQGVPFMNGASLDPANNQSEFVEFFDRLYNLIDTFQTDPLNGDPWKVMACSRIINRNTPWLYQTIINPAELDLALLKAIAEPDVLNHDLLYPTKVSVTMQDFYNG